MLQLVALLLQTLISSGWRTTPSPLLERLPRASGGTSCSHALPLMPLDLQSYVIKLITHTALWLCSRWLVSFQCSTCNCKGNVQQGA